MSMKGIESGEAFGTPTIGPAREVIIHGDQPNADQGVILAGQTHAMTLWELEEQLVGLMHAAEDPDISPEDRAGVEQAIALYVHKEIRKVDRIREYLRMCELGAQAAKEEAARHHQWAKMWETRKERIKSACKMAMEAFGARRLDGRSGYLLLKKNGGLQGLAIPDPAAVPDSYCDYTFTLTGDRLEELEEFCAIGWNDMKDLLGEPVRAPNATRIRFALGLPCPACAGKGEGEVGGEGVPPVLLACAKCKGTGKFLVPGARLEDRGWHVEVK